MQPLLRVDDSPLVGERRVHALRLLSESEWARFETDPHPERFVTGRMLLRELASGFTGLPLESITIATSCPDCDRPHGRPTIVAERLGPGLSANLAVSISHAGGRSFAAILEGADVGVDAERRDVSAERLDAIRDITGGEGLENWTAVEATLKADGRGLRVDPRRVEVVGLRATLDGVTYTLTDASDSEYVVTVAARRDA